MSLIVFESFLAFAERAVAAKAGLPPEIDAAEFENALVSYGVVVLYARIERCVQSAIDVKCGKCADADVRAFALSVKDEKTGKLSVDSLKATLKRFGTHCRSKFKKYVDKTDPEVSWESVMSQRASVAHEGKPASCTLVELRKRYEDVRVVLGWFCDSLGLSRDEIEGISKLIIAP